MGDRIHIGLGAQSFLHEDGELYSGDRSKTTKYRNGVRGSISTPHAPHTTPLSEIGKETYLSSTDKSNMLKRTMNAPFWESETGKAFNRNLELNRQKYWNNENRNQLFNSNDDTRSHSIGLPGIGALRLSDSDSINRINAYDKLTSTTKKLCGAMNKQQTLVLVIVIILLSLALAYFISKIINKNDKFSLKEKLNRFNH